MPRTNRPKSLPLIILLAILAMTTAGCEMNAPEPSIPGQVNNITGPALEDIISADGKFTLEVDTNGDTYVTGIDRRITSDLSYKLVLRVWSKKTLFHVHNCEQVVVGSGTRAKISGCNEVILEEGASVDVTSCQKLVMKFRSKARVNSCQEIHKPKGDDAALEKLINVEKIIEIEPHPDKETPAPAEKTPEKIEEPVTKPKQNLNKEPVKKPTPVEIDLDDAPTGNHQMQ